MKKYWVLAAGGVLAGILATASWGAPKCAGKKCKSPEACMMRNYIEQKEALAAAFGDQALRQQFFDSMVAKNQAKGQSKAFAISNAEADSQAAFVKAIDDQLQKMKQPPCGGGDALSQDIAGHTEHGSTMGQSMSGAADSSGCFTDLTVSQNGKAVSTINAHDKNGDHVDAANGVKTCQEIIDATQVHEMLHRQRCAKTNHYPPSTNLDAYASDDASAYALEAAYATDEMKDAGSLKCTAGAKRRKKNSDFLKQGVKNAIAAAPPPPATPKHAPTTNRRGKK